MPIFLPVSSVPHLFYLPVSIGSLGFYYSSLSLIPTLGCLWMLEGLWLPLACGCQCLRIWLSCLSDPLLTCASVCVSPPLASDCGTHACGYVRVPLSSLSLCPCHCTPPFSVLCVTWLCAGHVRCVLGFPSLWAHLSLPISPVSVSVFFFIASPTLRVCARAYMCPCMHAHGHAAHEPVHQRTTSRYQLSPYSVVPGERTQVVQLGGKCHYPVSLFFVLRQGLTA